MLDGDWADDDDRETMDEMMERMEDRSEKMKNIQRDSETLKDPLEMVSRTVDKVSIPDDLPYCEAPDEFTDRSCCGHFDKRDFTEVYVKLNCGWGYDIYILRLPDYWRISISIIDDNGEFHDDIGGSTPYDEAENEALLYISNKIQSKG